MHDSSGRVFGYQLTFFRTAFAPDKAARSSPWGMNDLYFAHAAITDIAGKQFVFKDRLERARPGLASASDQAMDVSLLDWSAKMNDKAIELRCPETDFAIDLTCTDGRGPVLEGPGGVNVKGHEPGQASYYYSMTRLKTVGTLTIKGKLFHVDGLSWMDHEFSSDALAKNQVGWDWMGLQLDDGTDLMVYRMRDKNGSTDYLSGTRITKSDTSGASYPQRWKLSVGDQAPLVITSDLPGQELITTASTKVTYFEGSATVRDEHGRHLGAGYLEMTGYK
jgi:predicted secreted hydrolase